VDHSFTVPKISKTAFGKSYIVRSFSHAIQFYIIIIDSHWLDLILRSVCFIIYVFDYLCARLLLLLLTRCNMPVYTLDQPISRWVHTGQGLNKGLWLRLG